MSENKAENWNSILEINKTILYLLYFYCNFKFTVTCEIIAFRGHVLDNRYCVFDELLIGTLFAILFSKYIIMSQLLY